MARRAMPRQTPVFRSISYDDLRFVNEYEARLFQSPGHIDAYQMVHPHCKRESARVSAERLLQKPTVRQEIENRLDASRAITVQTLGACLVRYRQWAEEAKDYVAGASIAMDQAKLGGLLIEKREVKELKDNESQQIRRLVASAMTTIPSGVSATENG